MKKTKKGFTLIELLAVIAILAVLAIVAVPAVINMYTSAKQNAFMAQAKSIFKAAQQRFMSDQLGGATGTITYCHNTGGDSNPLALSGDPTVYYKIAMDASGNVTSFQIKDATYGFADITGPVVVTDISGTPPAASTVTITAC